MLQYLRIKNLALMDEVALEFEEGFTAVTGETGAGKSVLLGALSILSGARVDKTIIRSGADACEVEAGLFFRETTALDEKLESLELPLCDAGSLILRRIFSRRKMPKVQVNGVLTTLANLRVIGEVWIDFHGSGEPQKLFLREVDVVPIRENLLELPETLDGLPDRLEIGQHPAQPAMANEGHAATLGFLFNRFLRRAFRSDKQDGAAIGNEFTNELGRLTEQRQRAL